MIAPIGGERQAHAGMGSDAGDRRVPWRPANQSNSRLSALPIQPLFLFSDF